MKYNQKQLATLVQEVRVTEEDINGMGEDQLFKYVREQMGRDLGCFITDNILDIPVDFSFTDDYTPGGWGRNFKLELIVIDRESLDELMHYKKMYEHTRGAY